MHYNMLNYNAFNFDKYNISKDDEIILINYFEALALIGIEYHNNKELNDLEYGEI